MMKRRSYAAPLFLCLLSASPAQADKHSDRLEKEWKARRQLAPLLEALKAPDKMLRRAAAQVLGDTADSNAVEPLIGALKDSFDSTRAMAALSLGMLGDARAVAPLISALSVETDEATTSFILDALGKLRGPAADEALLQSLQAPVSDRRASAAKVIGRIQLRQAADLLAALVVDPNADARYHAANALLQIDEPRALAALDAAAKDADPKVRLTAQYFLKEADTRNRPSVVARGRKLTLLGIERTKTWGEYPMTYSAKKGFELAIVRVRAEIIERKTSEMVQAELVDEQDRKHTLASAGGGIHFQLLQGEAGEKTTLTFAIAVPQGARLRTLSVWEASFDLANLETPAAR